MIPYVVLLRISSFIYPQDYSEIADYCIFLRPIYENFTPFVLAILAVFLIFFQSFLINSLVNEARLNNKNSLIAGLFYATGVCLIPSTYILHPILIANTFIILSLKNLINLYKAYKPIVHTFMSGFYIGLAILISPQYLVLILFLIQSMLQLRDVSLKEFLQGQMGILCPIFLLTTLGVYVFGADYLENLNFSLSDFNITILENPLRYINIGILTFLLLFILIQQNNIRKKRSVKTHKVLRLLYILALSTLPMLLFEQALIVPHLLLLVVPGSILFSMYIFTKKKIFAQEVIHTIIILTIVVLQFF